MAFPSRIKLESVSSSAAGPPSLTDVRLRDTEVSRKKLQSVTRDGRYWIGERKEAFDARRKQSVPPVLAKLLLPGIVIQDHGLRQGASLLTDLAGVVLNLMAMGPMKVLCGFILYRNVPIVFRLLPSSSELGVFLIYGVFLTLLGYSEGLYHPATVREPREQRIILAKVVAWSAFLAGVMMQFSGSHSIMMSTLVIATPLNYAVMLGWRSGWRVARNGRQKKNVLIVGAGTMGRKAAAWLKQDQSSGSSVVGFLDNSGSMGGDVLGRIEDLDQVARAEFVDEVIIALPHQPDLVGGILSQARRSGLGIKIIPDLHGFEATKAALENCGGVALLTLHEEVTPEFSLLFKRGLDVMASTLALLVFAPLLAAIAVVIKLDSSGPVFYRALRMGKKGERFRCHKFRTMVTDADKVKEHLRARNERHGACFKISDDPRITRVGGFLRRYSLDELPQLWNVLCGDMSMVGPRPHPLDDCERYDLEDLRRLEVTPGITGLWQVTARRDPSFQRNISLDVEYIDHWNLWMDLRILYKTISVVLQGSGM